MSRLAVAAATLAMNLAALVASSGAVEVARAEVPSMANLRVISSEGPWQAESPFDLDWEQQPAAASDPPVAVAYQLYDGFGSPVGAVARRTEELRYLYRVPVPAPGVYTIEVWYEDAGGTAGPRAQTSLRYDPSRPAAPQPRSTVGWLAGDEPAVLQIGHPEGPPPPSGIRGYAFSIDRGGGSSPCALPGRCTLAETDLGGGAGDDTARLGPLPEGLTVVRVLAVSGAGVASPVATADFHVDATRPRVRLGGVPGGWVDGPVLLEASATDALSGMAPNGAAGPYTAIAVDGGPARAVAGDTVTILVSGSGSHDIAFFARDAAGNVADGTAGNPPPETATVRIDEDPPRVRFAAAQDPAEPERIEAVVEDPLSGPSADRGAIDVRLAGSKGPFQALPTEVRGGRLVAHWQSDSFPAGKYEFRATGYDRAGNPAAGSTRLGGGRMVLVNPVKTPTAIALWLAGKPGRRHLGTAMVDYDRRVRLEGQLRVQAGAALAGRPVTITEFFAAGARIPQRTTQVQSSADGSFSLRLAPGPSRRVVASFEGSRLLTRAASKAVAADVRGRVRLRASSGVARIGGAPVVFKGAIGRRNARLPQEGRPIEMQFRYPGASWSEFRTIQTDAAGRFRYPYAFSDDDSRGVRFQFRACAPTGDGWPYESACSRPVSVRGI